LITEKLQELKTIPQKGVVKSLLQRSILNSILEIEIAQHGYNYIKTISPILNLATRQINEIKRISNINIAEVIHAAGLASRNYLPRIFKEKYHLSYKSYNQKLAS
jgi:AraC-like DNA-binding protein